MNTVDFLKAHEHKSESDFIAQAQYLKDNWAWLQYSYAIAITLRRRMKELGITQKDLAQQLGCTQQHVSVLLGGKANMTLETIAKLEQALHCVLIGNSLQGFHYPIPNEDTSDRLNDPVIGGQVPDGVKTGKMVDGYKPRKKKGPQGSK
jgi:transcriptional regulator with XRE-family HTH domain